MIYVQKRKKHTWSLGVNHENALEAFLEGYELVGE